jgi:hypothetical protein
MVVVTGSNHIYKKILNLCIRSIKKLEYRYVVYDLGNLKYGKNFFVDNESFQKYGFYCKPFDFYHSTCLHKPKLILDALNSKQENLIYIDSDVMLQKKIDDVFYEDFDIAVTVRRSCENENEPVVENKKIMGSINAGVIFIKPTKASFDFILKWIVLTESLQNDQWALNEMISNVKRNCVVVINGVRILCLETDCYNFYYFNEAISKNTKIIHYKNKQFNQLLKHNLVI